MNSMKNKKMVLINNLQICTKNLQRSTQRRKMRWGTCGGYLTSSRAQHVLTSPRADPVRPESMTRLKMRIHLRRRRVWTWRRFSLYPSSRIFMISSLSLTSLLPFYVSLSLSLSLLLITMILFFTDSWD